MATSGQSHGFAGDTSISRTCPHCGVSAAFSLRFSEKLDARLSDTALKVAVAERIACVYKCPSCMGPLFVDAWNPVSIFGDGPRFETLSLPAAAPVDLSIPKPVRTALYEARLCLAVKAWMAAAAMARRAVEDIANSKQAAGRVLCDKIDDLAARGLITAGLQETAHEVRHLGNAGVHDGGGEEDAREAVQFVESLTEFIYIIPAKTKASKAKRTAGSLSRSTNPATSIGRTTPPSSHPHS